MHIPDPSFAALPCCLTGLQELTIENEIKKLADVWREQRFDLGKYMKVRVVSIMQVQSVVPPAASWPQNQAKKAHASCKSQACRGAEHDKLFRTPCKHWLARGIHTLTACPTPST
jgi:hypothetical protein